MPPYSIAEAFGGTVTHAPELMHGKTSRLVHENVSVFKDVPCPFTATRYHSLAVVPETMPDVLETTSTTDNGIIMVCATAKPPCTACSSTPNRS